MTPNTFSVQFIIKADKKDNSGFVPIYAKIFINGCKIELSTFQRVNPSHWDNTKKQIKLHIKKANEINQFLENFKSRIYSTYSKVLTTKSELNMNSFKEEFYGTKVIIKEKTLIATTEEHNKEFEKLVGKKYSYGSYKNYKTTLTYLREFVPFFFKQKDIELSKVDFKFCEAYYSFLTSQKPCNNNGANKHIQRVRKIINYAVNSGYITISKMNTYKLENTPTTKPFLTLDEISRIESLKIQRKSMNDVRNVFIFQCFTGLAYSDIKQLNNSNIILKENGYWIKMKRQKTNISFSVPLLVKAVEILKLYFTNKAGLVFPVLSNNKMNQYLKIIQELAGIDKTLTTHMARHSFATSVTLANGVPIETVSKMLGHTKLSTTQIYAKVLDSKIENDMEDLKKKLK